MFTGIIEGVGSIKEIRTKGDGLQIHVETGFDLEQSNIGDSIAVNGCCLTITSRLGSSFWADVSSETLSKSTLSQFKLGDPVNLERALRVGDRLGGHIVQGHVDGVGKVLEIKHLKSGIEFIVEIPSNLLRYIVDKGSIAVDGVSLTVNHVAQDCFSLFVIPHTQLQTTFSKLSVGKEVNLEVDIIGKYVERLTHMRSDEYHEESPITREFLRKHGF